MTWKDNDIKKSQENHNTEAYEEERNCPRLKRQMMDIQEGTVLQRDMSESKSRHDFNKSITKTSKFPLYKKG
jgi:phage pi2 protein 07